MPLCHRVRCRCLRCRLSFAPSSWCMLLPAMIRVLTCLVEAAKPRLNKPAATHAVTDRPLLITCHASHCACRFRRAVVRCVTVYAAVPTMPLCLLWALLVFAADSGLANFCIGFEPCWFLRLPRRHWPCHCDFRCDEADSPPLSAWPLASPCGFRCRVACRRCDRHCHCHCLRPPLAIETCAFNQNGSAWRSIRSQTCRKSQFGSARWRICSGIA